MESEKNTALIILLTLSIIFWSFTGKERRSEKEKEQSKYSNVALSIVGYIENAGIDFQNAKYRLYRDNNFVAGGATDRFGTMEVKLMRNSHYLLEVYSPGYVHKKIYINTFVPENYRKTGHFDFGISLIPAETLEENDLCTLDLPFAIVYFDLKKKIFDYDRAYTEQMENVENDITARTGILLN